MRRIELRLGSSIRRLGVAAGLNSALGFSPLSLAPVQWLMADVGTLQTSGGSVASADADPVGQWLDQSGQGNHAAQATAGNRAALKLSILNGRPAVRFNGTTSFMTAALSVAQPFTVAFVATNLNTGSGQDVYRDNSSGAVFYLSGGFNMFAGSNIGPAVATAGPSVFVQIWNGASSSALTDGSTIMSGDAGALGVTSPFTIGAEFASGTNPTGLDLCEWLVLPGALSVAQLASLRSYLQGRWGTP